MRDVRLHSIIYASQFTNVCDQICRSANQSSVQSPATLTMKSVTGLPSSSATAHVPLNAHSDLIPIPNGYMIAVDKEPPERPQERNRRTPSTYFKNVIVS